jgi:hypothetical protein
MEEARQYEKMQGLSGACPHGTAPLASLTYHVKKIPHKTIIDKFGVVVKNFDDVYFTDVDALM